MREDEADSLVRLGKDYLHIRNYDKAMEYLGYFQDRGDSIFSRHLKVFGMAGDLI